MVGQRDLRGCDEPHLGGRLPPPMIPSLPATEEGVHGPTRGYPRLPGATTAVAGGGW
jgi:hypothetical protein